MQCVHVSWDVIVSCCPKICVCNQWINFLEKWVHMWMNCRKHWAMMTAHGMHTNYSTCEIWLVEIQHLVMNICWPWPYDGKFCVTRIMTQDVGDVWWEKLPCFLRRWDLLAWAYNLRSIGCYLKFLSCAKSGRRCFWNHERRYCTCSATFI